MEAIGSLMMIVGFIGAVVAVLNRRRKAARSENKPVEQIHAPDEVSLDDLQHQDWRRRVAAIQKIEHDATHLPQLFPLLSDPDSDVREAAAQTIAEIGVAALPELRDMLQDAETETRVAVVDAMRRMHNKGAVWNLADALKDESAWVRLPAAQALGELGDVRGIKPLIAALTDQDSRVREAARESLVKIGTPDALDAARR